MAQKLILPIDDCQINAGYKSKKYQKEWSFNHYGVDLIERSRKRTIEACGEGVVIACGMDGQTDGLRLGNCIVIVYKDAELPGGGVKSLSSRMYHLDKILCKAGDKVAAGTVLGEYGSTGQYSSGPHLHIEFDTDIQYPAYAYGIGRSGNIIKQGTIDSTVDPCKVFWLGKGQSLYAPTEWIAEGWVDAASVILRSAEAVAPVDPQAELARLRTENASIKDLIKRINTMTS